jgi:putative DNA primase/helicase
LAAADGWVLQTIVMDCNAGLITYLQRTAGYSLTGDVGEQILLFLFGTGANGKSTYLLTLKNMLELAD